MSQDRASMVITEEDERAVLAAIAQIESILKNLTAFEPGERKTLRMMGPRNEPFARETLTLMEQNRKLVPATLDIDAMRADLDAFDRMRRINASLQRLATLCYDTESALGSDVLDAALTSYSMLKVFGSAHGLEESVKSIGARFAAQGRRKPKPKDEPESGA